jgi:ATP-dependent helicase/nuclease subunit B
MTSAGALPTAPAVAHELLQAVLEAKGGDPLAPVTVLAPSNRAVVSARRTLTLAARDRPLPAVANVSSTTLGDLARTIAAPVLRARGLLPVPSVVERETIRTVAAGGPSSFASLAGHPRTLAAVERAFAELRGLSEPALEAIARSSARGARAAALLVAVRRQLHESGFADSLDLREAALSALGSGTPLAEEPGALVLLEPAPNAPGEVALLAALSARWPLRPVGPAPFTTATEHWACADAEQEARNAVRLVLAGLEQGLPLWRQAVFHPPGPGYARLLHQQLAVAGVPTNGPELRRLDRTGPGRALLGLLELAGGDWPRHQVLAWMSSAPLRTGTGDGRPVPVSRWNALSAAAGVVRGPGQWRQRLARLAERQPEDADEATALAGFVEELAGRSGRPFESWAERARWAASLLEEHLDAEGQGPWPAEQSLALDQVLEVVHSLADLDTVSADADLAGFRRAVRAELEARHLDTAELPGGGVGDGVLVAPYDQARGLGFHSAVVVGLADALVPGHGGEDAVLSDELRALDSSGALPTRAQRQDDLLEDVRFALSSGSVRRVVSHPLTDPRTGRLQVPTRYMDQLVGAAVPVQRVDSLAASLRAPGPPMSAGDLTLRSMSSWSGRGLDMLVSPPVLLDDRLRTGIGALRGRASDLFTRFDGWVGTGRVTPYDPDNPVSATRLETYAECPRRFLFERVLNVHERTLPEDLWRIEARDRGSLVHAILERYLDERIAGAPRSLQLLLSIAEEHLDEAAAGGMVGKPLLWRLDRAAILRDLHLFYAEEGDLEPLAAELAFGEEDGGHSAVPVVLGDGRTVRFRGRADRVDRAPGGDLVVSDYKTGRQSHLAKLTSDLLVGGRRLQLPLYALAARHAFGVRGSERVLARYWMVSADRTAAFYTLELTEEAERHFTEVVGRMTRAIEAGCFPAIPGARRDNGFDVCAWCDFDQVCPVTRDRQWAAKRNDVVLAPVVDLLEVEVPQSLAGAVERT